MTTESFRLPEELLLPRGALFCSARGESLAEGVSGRLWRFRPDDAGAIEIIPTGVNLADFLPADYRENYRLLDYAGDRLLISCDGVCDDVYVFDLRAGRLLMKLQNFFDAFESACLVPGADSLFGLAEEHVSIIRIDYTAAEKSVATIISDAGQPSSDEYRTTLIWNFEPLPRRSPELLDSPGSLRMIPMPEHRKLYHVVIGCCGYVFTALLSFPTGRPETLEMVSTPKRLWDDFVFDPVEVETLVMYPYVFLSHGYGTGLEALNLNTGAVSSCPRSPNPERPPSYGTFGGLVAGHDGSMLVWTVGGWMRWRIGNDFRPLGLAGSTIVSEDQNGIWCIPHDDRALISKYRLKD